MGSVWANQAEMQPASASQLRKIIAYGSCALASTVPLIENIELIHAAYNYRTYEAPAYPDDIMPELIPCEIEPLPSEKFPDYIPKEDDSLTKVHGLRSAATKVPMPLEKTTKFAKTEPLIGARGKYFDTLDQQFTTGFGAHFNVFKNRNDIDFEINQEAFNRMVSMVFFMTHVHKNPQIRQLLECKRNQVLSGGWLNGKQIDLNIIATGDKELYGNNVVTLSGAESNSHSHGLGLYGTAFKMFGKNKTADAILIVTSGSIEPLKGRLSINKRLLHELIHVLLFQDISYTAKEMDEQERAVKYITDNLWMYYLEKELDYLVITPKLPN